MRSLIISVITLFFLSSLCFAETITLKSGKEIEVKGKILEKTDDYIKVEYKGAPITYRYDILEGTADTRYLPGLGEEPPVRSEYIKKGSDYVMKGEYQQAITELEKEIEINPDNAEAYKFLGHAYDGLGQFQKAITFFKKALELDPSLYDIYSNIGLSYHKLGKQDEAIASYQKGIQLNPNDYYSYVGLAQIYSFLKQPEQELMYYKKAVEINPNSAEAYFNMGMTAYLLGLYKEAREYLQKSKELSLQRKGDVSQDISMIEEYLSKIPAD